MAASALASSASSWATRVWGREVVGGASVWAYAKRAWEGEARSMGREEGGGGGEGVIADEGLLLLVGAAHGGGDWRGEGRRR